jgi:hypothetical protein
MNTFRPAALAVLCAIVSVVCTSSAKPVEATYESEMNPAYAAVQIVTTADPSGLSAKSAGFIHPGVLVNRAQLDEIKRRGTAGIEPQKTAFAAMKADPLCALDYIPHPVPNVMSGPQSRPEI